MSEKYANEDNNVFNSPVKWVAAFDRGWWLYKAIL